ncbi:SDR family NAD(P)-dependent oxidoreductase [Nordella sp. HKS 07]|uniref:SDR family NAD(P)-dependent oxidoreductase n=1 Tax=Nordella sp. HKS 07 TaxID=2712222 RepID=UPI0013E16AB5|nr:SDR family NAD(P)-dependent oxidoreductase [Nordella sp. HKS 07]QIG52232.1 SDR family NAD(P)-dependent oxidoreductase [Nordella sp. HKS 07]
MKIAALKSGNVAVVTGGASGIGLAAARKFLSLGLKVCIADRDADRLTQAASRLGGTEDCVTAPCDVSLPEDLTNVERMVRERFGHIDVVMNNAGIQPGSQIFGAWENWDQVLAVNLLGVIHGTRVFAPNMIAQGTPGLIINTGSKQGITTPPGDPAYNVAKAGVKVFTEALQHELRSRKECQVTAHLLIPGFVFTGLTARGRTEKPEGAWTPEQTVEFMLESLERGDFYILCPDNEATRDLDEKRIAWAAGDIIENRPPLSRWHPDYDEGFAAFVKQGKNR